MDIYILVALVHALFTYLLNIYTHINKRIHIIYIHMLYNCKLVHYIDDDDDFEITIISTNILLTK